MARVVVGEFGSGDGGVGWVCGGGGSGPLEDGGRL